MAIRTRKCSVWMGVVLFLIVGICGIVVWRLHSSNALTDKIPLAALSSDAPKCADVGRDILYKKGNVVDSAIATLLCMGVIQSHSMGIGGGFFMVIYNATTKESVIINARETAPLASNRSMFGNDSNLPRYGGLAVAVPGEMKGYWHIYKKYGGGVSWAEIFEPAIQIAENGFHVTRHQALALKTVRELLIKQPTMDIYIDPVTKDVYKEGVFMKRPDLANTLRRIANSNLGGDEFYLGDVARDIVNDLKKMGGIITMEDMRTYDVEETKAVEVDLYGNMKLHTIPPPGSGALLAFMLKTMSVFFNETGPPNLNNEKESILYHHRLAEVFKHAYAKRSFLGDPFDLSIKQSVNELVTNLTDDAYIEKIRAMILDSQTFNTRSYYGGDFEMKEDHGTAHLSMIGPEGSAISVTSTVNLYFGALIRSVSTGIIYNDEMDDFSAPNIVNYFGIPPSHNNFIKPGKRPLSSMSPAIITDSDGKVRLAIGAAGGTRITTATAFVTLRNLWLGNDLAVAVNSSRIHHQLYPMELTAEKTISSELIDGLKNLGHNVSDYRIGSSVVCAVSKIGNEIEANSDFRKNGDISYVYES